MVKIKEFVCELFASKEMAEHLIANISNLSQHHIRDMICKAPISIHRKAKMLSTLAKTDDFYKKSGECALRAIAQLHSESTESVFTVKNCWHDEEWPMGYGESVHGLYATFEKVKTHIAKDMQFEEWSWEDKDILSWYEITKWRRNKTDDYEPIITYELIDDQIMYFAYKDGTDDGLFKPDCHLNLSTPFKTGDIVTVDCRPHVPNKTVLILENVNPSVCCALQGLCYNESEKLFFTGAVKHGSVYKGWNTPRISPLYRIAQSAEILPEREQIFKEV